MEDEIIITDTDLEQTTGPRGVDDISVEIMDCYGVVQSVVDVLSREAVLPRTLRTLQEPHDGNHICRTA